MGASLATQTVDLHSSVFVDPGFYSMGSVVVVHGLSCSTACRLFPDRGSSLCP